MEDIDWKPFLTGLSGTVLTQDVRAPVRQVPDQYHKAGYLGFTGATEQEIVRAENRLGIRLPPSYRAFLQASNGWGEMGITFPGKLWSAEEIDWLRVRNQETIDLWGPNSYISHEDMSPEEHLASRSSNRGGGDFRGAYLNHCLEISDWGDACILFLCPEIRDANGEWECWHLASWIAGAHRFASFADWMIHAAEFVSREPSPVVQKQRPAGGCIGLGWIQKIIRNRFL